MWTDVNELKREAQAIGALSHPNICTLHDIVDDGGTLCLVMELLEDETLAFVSRHSAR
jgi:serine/threonine protein kinase